MAAAPAERVDEPGWDLAPGQELVPGLLAWAALGDGPRCATWLAWDVARWSPVTVKLPLPATLRAGRALAALAPELEATADLAHPGLRRLLDARLDGPLPHLVLEYVEGPTLDDALAEEGPFDPVEVILTGMQLAAALGYLHGRGLVHLDLKPENVVLRDGRPVLIDLGFTRPIGTPPPPGRVRGSPPWMAPEQIRRAPAAPGMDLFALGAVMYELACGERAFEPEDAGPRRRRWPQLERQPPSRRLRALAPAVPAALAGVVDALLDPDPAARPERARQVLAALAGALPAGAAAERPWPDWATPALAVGCGGGGERMGADLG